MNRHLKSQSGMTLIELMVATAIMGLMMGIIYTFFIGQSRAVKQQQGTINMQENAQFAMEFMARDLRSTGFMMEDARAFMLENDCGGANGPASQVGYDGTNFNTTGAEAIADGNVDGLDSGGIDEACPNGSDRLTIARVPLGSRMSRCNEDGICLDPVNGAENSIEVPCEDPADDTTCPETVERAGLGLECGYKHTGNNPLHTTTVCNAEDSTKCMTVSVIQVYCPTTDSQQESGTVRFKLGDPSTGNPINGSDWSPVDSDGCASGGGNACAQSAKNGAAMNAFGFRTFQLLDLNQDGSTELVFSDNFFEALTRDASDAIEANWRIIAFNIDDFQVSFSREDAPDTFYNADPSGTEVDLYPLPGIDSLGTLIQNDQAPRALRVSVIARSEKRVLAGQTGTSDVVNSYRAALEDNDPPPEDYDPSSATGCGNNTPREYARCTENGNAKGYRRRVVTQLVGLRSLVNSFD